jgi:hypothetical protein
MIEVLYELFYFLQNSLSLQCKYDQIIRINKKIMTCINICMYIYSIDACLTSIRDFMSHSNRELLLLLPILLFNLI